MQDEIVISGFGGQGVLFTGQLLAYAGLMEGKQVAWVPSYGPEMRGGTAHATVIISEEQIGSLIVSRPNIAIVMNLPSMERYNRILRPGGLLVVNSSLIPDKSDRQDITALYVPANDIALNLGNDKLANVVILGALIAERPLVSLQSLSAALKKVLGEKKKRMFEVNEHALHIGVEHAQKERAVKADQA